VEGISAVQSSAGNRTVLSVKEFSQPSVSLSLCDAILGTKSLSEYTSNRATQDYCPKQCPETA
jgi:hypothetical protein